ncbi:MAG: hypothetical protein RMI74_01770, partial [Thermodesulfobacterium sp.]|nr:hypothetical protein [Thermodesulfobacterium sp.]
RKISEKYVKVLPPYLYKFRLLRENNLIKEAKRLERLRVIKEAFLREEVLFRLKVIEFYDKYGIRATKATLGVSKKEGGIMD